MKTNILFVDDEMDIVDAYKRMLFKFRNVWGTYFACSAKDAIELLDHTDIDIVITDMRMPETDGVEFLKQIQAKYPDKIRIIITGQMEINDMVVATGVAHQMIAKPLDPNKLIGLITDLVSEEMLENSAITKALNAIVNLPTIPEIYFQIDELLAKTEPDVQLIAELIHHDLGLTAKILQVVNSGFFGLQTRVTNVVTAINYIGINVVKSIIMHQHLFSSNYFKRELLANVNIIGNHSLCVAGLARNICKVFKYNNKTTETCFILGILHDIGRLGMLAIEDYSGFVSNKNALKSIPTGNFELVEFEKFDINHSTAGAYLIGIWGLPKEYIEIIRWHHTPQHYKGSDKNVMAVIYLAEFLSKMKVRNIYQTINTNEEYDVWELFPDINKEFILQEKLGEMFSELMRHEIYM